MCLNPVLMPNPNYNAFSRNSRLSEYKDTTARYIYRPCGVCSQCLQLRQVYFIQRSQMEALDNDLWYCTLTYNKKHLPTIDINGYKHKYADYEHIRLLMQRLRDNNVFGNSFRYTCVSEFGGERHRPHWHILFSVPKIPKESFAHKMYRERIYYNQVLKYWAENIGTRKNPIYDCRLTLIKRYGRSTYDFHYVNPSLTDDGELDVAFYITKYVLKPNDYVKRLKSALYFNCKPDDFHDYWQLIRPKILVSKYYGNPFSPSVASHIRKGIDLSINYHSPFPYFINPLSGQTFPLSPYYRDFFLTDDDLRSFYWNSSSEALTDYDNFTFTEDKYTLAEKCDREKKFSKLIKQVQARDSYPDISDFTSLQQTQLLNDYGDYKQVPFMAQDFADCWQDFDDFDDNPVDYCDTLF